MAQQGQAAPSVSLSQGGVRQQVPLRDYLNSRIAPFVKKAMTQSLEVDAEYPLQWLGECLINQSILYEGNPDSTGIRERFLYNFDPPSPAQQQQHQAPQSEVEMDAEPEVNGVAASSTTDADHPNPAATQQNSLPNGGTEEKTETDGVEEPAASHDTEMADTS